MDVAQHQIMSARPSGMTPRRALIIGAVGLLHVGAIYAIVNGMAGSVVTEIIRDIQITPVKDEVKPPTTPPPPIPTIIQPHQPVVDTMPPPDIPIESANTDTITVKPTPLTPANLTPVPDTPAMGIVNTHSVPPYPADARALSHDGIVTLSIVVSAQGEVMGASVVATSGHAELDQAAVAWVIAHWKYKPAIQNGVAIPSSTRAMVKFDLTQARR